MLLQALLRPDKRCPTLMEKSIVAPFVIKTSPPERVLLITGKPTTLALIFLADPQFVYSPLSQKSQKLHQEKHHPSQTKRDKNSNKSQMNQSACPRRTSIPSSFLWRPRTVQLKTQIRPKMIPSTLTHLRKHPISIMMSHSQTATLLSPTTPWAI